MATTITMRDSRIITIEQLKAFAQLDRSFQFSVENKREKYRWIEDCLRKFRYHGLKTKKEKSGVCAYIRKVTSMSRAQLKRLIRQHKRCGKLIPNYGAVQRNGFRRKYSPTDIALLIKTDVTHNHLSGEATQKILQREHRVYHHEAYKTISEISVSHLYNIRNHNRQYTSSRAKWITHTRAVQVLIGIRAKPRPEGRPGFLRVDTVHSGDLNGRKGAYHINIVDEVTQWEVIATVEAISEYFLTPVIEELLRRFPFVIHEFHADNGSEYINHVVAELLAKLYIRLTKSRARYSNDNALVESKNGSIIRKLYGRNHIPATHALIINEFNLHYVNIYLNYHRPCGFADEQVDARGKIKKQYTHWMTPYEKLKSLPNAEQYLKEGVAFVALDAIAAAESDNDFAEKMHTAKVDLCKKLKKV
jgi:transposase InsO family protein